MSIDRTRKLDEISDETRAMDQHVTSLEHGARQLRLTMEADGPANTNTREHTQGAATAVQSMLRGDGFSARRVEPGPNTSSSSFGVKAEPPALPCRDDVVIESGDATPKSCLPSLEMRSPIAAGGLVPIGETSTATETTSNEPLLWFYMTEELNPKKKKIWTSIPSAWYDSSFRKLLPASSGLRVIETKPTQNMMFDPGGSQGRLRACPFLGSWRALVYGKVMHARAVGDELQRFSGGDSLGLLKQGQLYAVPEKVSPTRVARGYTDRMDEQRSHRRW